MVGTSAGIVEQANAAKRLGDEFVPPRRSVIRLPYRKSLHPPTYDYVVTSGIQYTGWRDIRYPWIFWIEPWKHSLGRGYGLNVQENFDLLELPEDCPPFDQWERPPHD